MSLENKGNLNEEDTVYFQRSELQAKTSLIAVIDIILAAVQLGMIITAIGLGIIIHIAGIKKVPIFEVGLVVLFILKSVQLIFAVLLIQGATQKNMFKCQLWMRANYLICLITIIYVVVQISANAIGCRLLPPLISIIVTLVFLIVVRQFMQHLQSATLPLESESTK